MDTHAFFARLFRGCTGHLEIRLLDEASGKTAAQKFFPLPAAIAEAADYALAATGRYHVYFGVYPRANPHGSEADVTSIQCLFADLDAKDYAGGEQEIMERLAVLTVDGWPPSILVRSGGGGRHAYWLLERSLALPAARADRRQNIRDALWAIGDALGLAPKANVVHDLARLLRVPGTTNIKAKYATPQPCEVEWQSHRQYRPSAFRDVVKGHQRPADRLPSRQFVAFSAAAPESRDARELLEGLAVSEAILDLIRHGAAAGERSESDQRVIVALLRAGATPDRVRDIFSCPELAIGVKYRAHGAPDHYLGYSISKAQAWIAGHPDLYPQVDQTIPQADRQALEALLVHERPQLRQLLDSSFDGHKLTALVELARKGAPHAALYAAARLGAGDDLGRAARLYRHALELAQKPRSLPRPRANGIAR